MIRKIPVVFAFDDNYALPASIAIKSLLDCKKTDTTYDIIVFHDGLQTSTIHKMETICPIRWIKIDNSYLKNAPVTSNWPLAVYYRLLIANLITDYDKIIWSDVDVLFRDDLTNIYNTPLGDADWAGVIAEQRDETNGVHQHFPENKKPFVHMSGFMVINAKKWRDKNLVKKFFDIISKYNKQLKMFDLEILNLAAKEIKSVPFKYCVLENIYDAKNIELAPEYPWLVRAHGKQELISAKEKPAIIHYAGRSPKIWLRKYDAIPKYYWKYIKKSPFYNRKDYFPGLRPKIKVMFLYILIKICPIKKYREKIKTIYKQEMDKK